MLYLTLSISLYDREQMEKFLVKENQITNLKTTVCIIFRGMEIFRTLHCQVF